MRLLKYFICCISALSVVPSFSQTEENPSKKMTVDAHLGMSLSNYLLESVNFRPGVLAGVGLNIGNGCFSFNPELNYSMIGANDVMSADWEELKRKEISVCPVATETLHYLEIPLYFKWTFGNNDVKPIVAIAPTFALGLSGTRSYVTEDFFMEGDVQNKTPLFAPDEKSPYDDARYNRFDASCKLKTGVQIKNHYEALAGFRMGFSPIERTDYELHFSDCVTTQTSWNLFFTFGYRF